MDTNTIPRAQMTVDEVLSAWPVTHAVFTAMKTNCVGCRLQRFCTLRDVSEAYQIPFQQLTGELDIYIQNSSTLKGVSHE